MKSKLRSAGAILAGLLTIIVLSNGTDTILEITGVFPSIAEQRAHGFTTTWMVLLALAYRIAFMVIGGYLTARLAPNRALRHCVVLGVIGVFLGIAGAVATANLVPAWFSIALIVLGLPSVLLGGRLAERSSARA